MHRSIEFTELKPRIWQQLYSIYQAHSGADSTKESVAALLIPPLENAGFSHDDSSKIAAAFIRSFDAIENAKALGDAPDAPDYESASSPSGRLRLTLSLLDVNCLRSMLASEPSYDARRLLVAFTAWDRANPHPSGWIRYDRDSIMCLAGLTHLRPSEQEALTQLLHRSYGLDMQVVGSNSPIPCFRLSWLEEEPPIDFPSNPHQDIAPLSPSSIVYAVCEVLGLPPKAPASKDNATHSSSRRSAASAAGTAKSSKGGKKQ